METRFSAIDPDELAAARRQEMIRGTPADRTAPSFPPPTYELTEESARRSGETSGVLWLVDLLRRAVTGGARRA